jgi:hypothetical protein
MVCSSGTEQKALCVVIVARECGGNGSRPIIGLYADYRSARPSPQSHENTWIKFLAMEMDSARAEVTLADGTRIDILTPHRAIEVDWVKKWPEAIGQACFYAAMTSRSPTILLLVRDRKTELRFIHRAIIAARLARVIVCVYDTRNAKYLQLDDPPKRKVCNPP